MWAYVYTDRNNDFLAHAGRKGMKWGKHIFGNAAEEMRQAIARAKASAPAQTNATSSGRKRNVSGEATGSMERRESVSGGPANPNGAYNRAASAQTSSTSSNGPKLFDDTAAKIASDKARYEESKRTSPNGLQGRKRNVSGEATGSMERRDTVGRTTEQRDAFNQWNNRSDVAKKFEEMKRRLKLTSRSKAVRHSAVWTYHYTDYNNDYEDFLMHHGILGQKWGVRRYQNPDGSLTPKGRERYRKLADSYKKGEEHFYYKVNSLKEVKNFSKENKKDKNALLDAQYEYDLAGMSYNKAAYAYAEKKAGASYDKIIRMNDAKKRMRLDAFLEAGIEFADTEKGKAMGKKLSEAREDYIAKSKAYEHKATQFVKDLLSDYGNTPIPGTLSIDTKTWKARESTLTEQMAIEMLRDAQRGRIDF